MISCPVCHHGLDLSKHPVWHFCACQRFSHNRMRELWIFRDRVGHANRIEFSVDGRLVHVDKRDVRHRISRVARDQVIREFINNALTQEVMES